MQLKSVDDSQAASMPGIRKVFRIKTHEEGYSLGAFDNDAFNEVAVVVGNSTWEVMKAKEALKTEWELAPAKKEELSFFGRTVTVETPAGLESSKDHRVLVVVIHRARRFSLRVISSVRAFNPSRRIAFSSWRTFPGQV